MNHHPYKDLPPRAFWRKAVSSIPVHAVDPVAEPPFKIQTSSLVASAGSCFAQHISRHLRNSGYSYLVTENAHPITCAGDAEAFNYGTFTARYGNIYTARQLVQLFDRAYGRFQPAEDVWQDGDNCFIDPFRPRIQPGGFHTLREYKEDRAKHFRCVREALETLDVFIFTLGLTEAWRSRIDGAVYPLCPGVAGGRFDEHRHEFHNFTVDEVANDLSTFIDSLQTVNPRARLILTVSPVPLIATATKDHVLSATTYSKSVLRVACHQVTQAHPDVCYFPSYEIITGQFNGGVFFAQDRRSVTEAGVSHVMRLFLKHFADAEVSATVEKSEPAGVHSDRHSEIMQHLVEVDCDEEALDQRD